MTKNLPTFILILLMASLGIWLSKVPTECTEYAPPYLVAGACIGFIIGYLFYAFTENK